MVKEAGVQLMVAMVEVEVPVTVSGAQLVNSAMAVPHSTVTVVLAQVGRPLVTPLCIWEGRFHMILGGLGGEATTAVTAGPTKRSVAGALHVSGTFAGQLPCSSSSSLFRLRMLGVAFWDITWARISLHPRIDSTVVETPMWSSSAWVGVEAMISTAEKIGGSRCIPF